jgi:hypothetical protein
MFNLVGTGLGVTVLAESAGSASCQASCSDLSATRRDRRWSRPRRTGTPSATIPPCVGSWRNCARLSDPLAAEAAAPAAESRAAALARTPCRWRGTVPTSARRALPCRPIPMIAAGARWSSSSPRRSSPRDRRRHGEGQVEPVGPAEAWLVHQHATIALRGEAIGQRAQFGAALRADRAGRLRRDPSASAIGAAVDAGAATLRPWRGATGHLLTFQNTISGPVSMPVTSTRRAKG